MLLMWRFWFHLRCLQTSFSECMLVWSGFWYVLRLLNARMLLGLLAAWSQLYNTSERWVGWWWFQGFGLGWHCMDVYNLKCFYHAVGLRSVSLLQCTLKTCSHSNVAVAVLHVVPEFIMLPLPNIRVPDAHNELFSDLFSSLLIISVE